MKMFAIYDIKAEAYRTPFFFPAIGEAVRAFADLVADSNSIVGRHPDDYKLVHVGEFNELDGEFVPCGLVSLGFGSSFVPKAKVMAVHGGPNGEG